MSEAAKILLAEQPNKVMTTSYEWGRYVTPLLLIISDYAMVVSALLTAWYLRGIWLKTYFPFLQPFAFNEFMTFFAAPILYCTFIAYSGLYSKRLLFWKSVEEFFKICFFVNVFALIILYVLGTIGGISRIFVALSSVLCFTSLCFGRWSMKKILITIQLWQKPVVIIGAGKTAELLAESFSADLGLGYKIVGLIEDQSMQERPLLAKYPHWGNFANAVPTIKQSGVQDVILAVPGFERSALLEIVYRIQPFVRNLTIVPNLFGMPLSNIEVETLFHEKTIMLRVQNNMALLRNRILKRVFDISVSILGSIVISPILLTIVALIYFSDPGPVFFAHWRVGVGGKRFPCYKFRSMIVNSQAALLEYLDKNPAAREEWERDFKLKDDPRVTRIGKLLRKTSLDELPQLFNVICGDMSLVGPRPIVKDEVVKYGEYINDYYIVRPGMTGYWQVSGRNDVDYDRRVKMDSWYVRNWSLWQDIVLLMKTINVVFSRKGAY